MSVDNVIRSHNLPPTLQTATSSGTKAQFGLDLMIERLEHQLIVEALQASKGIISKAADQLKISERVLGLRIEKYQIDVKRYKKRTNHD